MEKTLETWKQYEENKTFCGENWVVRCRTQAWPSKWCIICCDHLQLVQNTVQSDWLCCLLGVHLNLSPHLSAPLTDKRYHKPERDTFLRWHNMASDDCWAFTVDYSQHSVNWMRPGVKNTPEIGLTIQICLTALGWFNVLDIFKIEVTKGWTDHNRSPD